MKKSSQKIANFLLPLVFLVALLFSTTSSAAQFTREDGTYVDTVLSKQINTVLLRQSGTEISYPFLVAGTPNLLNLSFDAFGENPEQYQYTIVRCNRYWQKTNLMEHQYMSGQNNGFIEDYRSSYNTYIRYTHYRLNFPSQEIQLKLSGNYVIKIYRNYDPDDVVIVRRFYLAEQLVSITGKVRAAMNPGLRMSAQQLDLFINLSNLKVPNVYNDLFVVVKQNNNDFNAVQGLQPQFVRGQELIYERMNELVFMAGNEYRPLDLRSIRVAGMGVAKLRLDSFYRAQTYTDVSRNAGSYTFIHDLNGHRVVAAENTQTPNTEADYVQTFFSYDSPAQTPVYIFGELTNWKIAPQYQLLKNPTSGIYETALMLKQGYVNYQYVTLQGGKINPVPFEGSYFETENDYMVLVYYRSPELNGDLLVGYKRFNSSME